MNLSRIKTLDLRPLQQMRRLEWDWPEVPDVAKRRVIRYVIKVDATAFLAALTEMQARIERLAILNIPIFGSPPRYRCRLIRQWYWWKIALHLGIFFSIGTCIGLLVDAWL